MRNRRSTEILAITAILGSLMALFLDGYGLPPRVDRKLHECLGRALAQEALNCLRPGGQITVITRDTEAFPQPAFDILLDSFRSELHRAGATLTAPLLIRTDPLRRIEVPAGDFFELIRRSGPERVLVSFLGPPLLTEEQLYRLGRIKPAIIALCAGSLMETIDLDRLFRANLLDRAIVSRRVPAAAAKNLTGVPAYQALYQTLRATNAAGSLTPPK